MSTPDTKQLVLEGRNDRIRALLEHADWLRGLARQLVRDGAEAEDVLQETLLVAGDSAVPAGVPERSWLAGIARNLVRTRRKREVRIKRREQGASRAEATTTTAADDAALIERQKILLEGVEELPEAQRRVILMRYYEGIPPRKIAAAEGVAVSTVHTRIQRGLESLRTQLDRSFGDRRTWATWMAPMGGVAPKAQGFAAMALLGVAITALAVSVGFSAWSLSQPSNSLTDDVEVELADVISRDSGERDSSSLLTEVPGSDEPATRSEAKSESSKPVSVRIVADGAAVPNAGVIALPLAFVADDAKTLYQLEATIWNKGTRFQADENGICLVDVPTPFIAIASDETRLGFQTIAYGAVDPAIELERAARLTIRVQDSLGAPLDSDELDGLAITAYTRLQLPKLSDPRASQDVNLGFTYDVKDGMACVQNSWLGRTWNQAGVGPENWQAASIEAVAFAIPGAAEFEPAAIDTHRFLPFKKRPSEQERTLTLPDLGSLKFTVVNTQGEVDPVNGTVSVSFRVPALKARGITPYTTELVDGVALFPRFVTGARPFEVTVSVPEAGADWSFNDVGPGREGERRNVTTLRPTQRALTAVLIDEDGQPLGGTKAALFHGEAGTNDGFVYKFIQGTSGPAGEVRFEIPDDSKIGPPFSMTAMKPFESILEGAIVLLDLDEKQVQQGADLGELVMRWEKQVAIEGKVVDEDGLPVPNARISLQRPGRFGQGVRPDADGTFSLKTTFEGSATLTARDNAGDFMPIEWVLDRSMIEEPLLLTMCRGATFLADIETSSLRATERTFRVILRDEDEGYLYVQTLGAGIFRAPALSAGRYSVELWLEGGSVPLTRVEGIAIAATGATRDPRVDGLRVSDLVREISVTIDGEVPKRPPTMRVMATPTLGERSNTISSVRPRRDDATPYLLPLRIPHSVLFERYDGRTAYYANGFLLEETVDLSFAEPFQVRVELQGRTDPDFNYSLRGEAGTSTAGTTVSVPSKDLDETSVAFEAQFPMAGVYRLYRVEKPEPSSGQGRVIAVSVSQATTATIEVREDEVSTLRIDAPVRE